jgi:hypothetical protein
MHTSSRRSLGEVGLAAGGLVATMPRVGGEDEIGRMPRPRRVLPRPPQPRRLVRSGGEWTQERVLRALVAWAGEVGGPPRSYDWSPAAARAGSFPLDGAAKWEREFPRWPHHALVRARLGSWRAALAAAGLPGAEPLRMARHERVQTAKRLQGRISAGEIAELIGVHERTVRDYWRAGTCARCGGVQIHATSSSCADCIPYVALARPPKRDVVRALRRWARETGIAPKISDWRQPGGKWEREYPAWPSTGDVLAHFDGWPQALAAAGLRPHRRTWTREAIITALQAWAEHHGAAPTHDDWATAALDHPPTSTVKTTFGSWSTALVSAGLTPGLHGHWTVEEILDGLRAFERDHGRPPRAPDLRDTRGKPYPPATAVIRTVGSLRAAYELLGWQAAWTTVTHAEILQALRAWTDEHGHAPSSSQWRRQRLRPGASVIIRRYGTWNAALNAALPNQPPRALRAQRSSAIRR